ncbi:atp4 subunit B of the stator stalk of mitochondrial F1F0 ATP synthase [Vanrija albida]|uniref:ATP synthase subunit 4 n=1 Tax=Vanrija albida TaxID=181172 RepID=A0ABR3QBH8_9TREE
MASRLALRNLRSAARPAFVAPRAIASQVRFASSQPTPDEKAAEIINAVPSTSLFTKTSGIILGVGVTAAAVSTEIYVANEETVLAAAFLIIFTAIAKNIGAPYTSWANAHIEKIKSVLNSARSEHTQAVTQRIDSVNQLKDVVPLTQQLYKVAKETNELEHSNFLLAQEAAVKHELKAVLDSWVRYEQQQREAEQTALVKSVTASIAAELEKPAFKKQLLEEALAQVEQIAKSKEI